MSPAELFAYFVLAIFVAYVLVPVGLFLVFIIGSIAQFVFGIYAAIARHWGK